MTSPLHIGSIQFNVDGVQGVHVSDIQPDTDSVQFVRLIQIYVDPPSNANRRPVVTLALYGGSQNTGDQSGLDIAIPSGVTF